MKHIQNEAGARAYLRGKGSGHIEIGQRDEHLDPMHILISSDKQSSVDTAKALAEDLVETIRSEFEVAKSAAASAAPSFPTGVPPIPLQMVTPFDLLTDLFPFIGLSPTSINGIPIRVLLS